MYRQSRARGVRDVTEAESQFCTISKHELFEHFSRVFQQGGHIDSAVPAEVPTCRGIDGEDSNPFAAEFTPDEI